MLPAQVSYWTLQETKRHNLEMEELGRGELAVRVGTLQEQKRNNLVVNAQQDKAIGIQDKDANTKWFSAVTGAEIGRMNAESNRIQAQASTVQAAAAMKNAETNAYVGRTQADLNTANAQRASAEYALDVATAVPRARQEYWKAREAEARAGSVNQYVSIEQQKADAQTRQAENGSFNAGINGMTSLIPLLGL